MAIFPESARTAAAYLGGGIARGIEQKAGQVMQAGQQLAAKGGVGQKVGQFLETVSQPVQQFGSDVAAGAKGAMKKRDVGLAAIGAGMTGAFVGGMGANAGVYALMDLASKNNLNRQPAQGTYGGNVMPADLQMGYIPMNVFGSPLTQISAGSVAGVKQAQVNQRMLRAALGPDFAAPEE